MTLVHSDGFYEDTTVCLSCEEVFGIVLKHHPAYDWQYDYIETLIEDRVYHVYRNPPITDELPYFNIREIPNE